ncbi:hypothetical protein WS67_15725 [Burkholderia singularis]|uniref:Serine--tRNA ligase n=1 Tax=Burkholderia singularis TaxID=1503053 RepID=A0A118DNW4_9BURK|nr:MULTISPECIES: DUF1839 family protein [Burkholderia]AOK31127.1 hypothetical protein AQ611_15295 [Burkholderia sp. Bp7605]KVE27099.1 hypothetical protein WS67_15725 [Burkholderia singularis]
MSAILIDSPTVNNTPLERIFAGLRHRAHHYRPHALHGPQMVWKQTNCYVDMWIEVLSWWGFNPYAALPFTIALDFEGDQFTFFKFPHDDLEKLYGIVVQEHAIFESVDVHIENQVARGHLMMVEVDAWYLPDTRGTSYHAQHTKTTIGIDAIDREQRRIGYFHNSGYYIAEGDDYDGLFGTHSPTQLMPYAECAKRQFKALDERDLCDASLALLARHLKRRPKANPITAFRHQLARDSKALASRSFSYFHAYSFNTLRQLGANFELFGRYLRWLEASGCHGAFDKLVASCDAIASEAMVLEFRLARASAKGVEERGESSLDVIEHAYTSLLDGVEQITPVSQTESNARFSKLYMPARSTSISR